MNTRIHAIILEKDPNRRVPWRLNAGRKQLILIQFIEQSCQAQACDFQRF